ncbi:MAG: FtsX-like permease family protein, partial [Bacteroidales bacterium]|nr:FtsX-like permease family protein [Bacteroidales bacterium]
MFVHNLKVAVRNLMKYRLQTVISVLSIAIGIVTLAIAHAVLARTTVPSIYSRPYYDRTYTLWLAPANSYVHGTNEGAALPVTDDILRALKRDGGLKSAEQMAVPNFMIMGDRMEFFLNDTTARMWQWNYTPIDPGYLHLVGIRSAITGRVIDRLKAGEAVISRQMAGRIFGKDCPVGAVTREPIAECPMPITIVDVYDDLSIYDLPLDDQFMYISLGEPGGDLDGRIATGDVFYTETVLVVLKEGYTTQQLTDEANARLKPFGLVATLKKTDVTEDVRTVITTQTLVHLIGALILIAALIGFLRMQVQLFRMRRREMALRITHGAKRRHLFGLLFTEVALVVLLSAATAMVMALWVENVLTTRFAQIVREMEFFSLNFAPFCLYIGGMLLVVCALVIWLTVARVRRANHGLAGHMRGSRSHLFRYVMLGLQVAISTVFICATFTVSRWSGLVLRPYHIPDDTAPYEECAFLGATEAQYEIKALKEEIGRLHSVEKMMPHEVYYLSLPEVTGNADAMATLQNQDYLPFLCTADTTILSFYDLRVKWLNKGACAGPCLLLNDSVYARLRSVGVALNGTLTLRRFGPIGADLVLPIAGTISYVPYERRQLSIAVCPAITDAMATDFVLVPRKGEYDRMMRETNDVIEQMVPTIVQPMTHNFHDYCSAALSVVNVMRFVSTILGVVSIVICAMSIYSTIALDTRSRRKEVAVRKVCGAKSGDIY